VITLVGGHKSQIAERQRGSERLRKFVIQRHRFFEDLRGLLKLALAISGHAKVRQHPCGPGASITEFLV
jgi:hypothetical protein